MKNILCYGDSNTWGMIPQPINIQRPPQRYPFHLRWTGALQLLLGNNYRIIEEGLNGRTIATNHPIPPDRNGLTYLKPCLYSQSPLDLIILQLGGNELKSAYQCSAKKIAENMTTMIKFIQSTQDYANQANACPAILLTSLPSPLPIVETYKDDNNQPLFADVLKKAKKVSCMFREIAASLHCHYINLDNSVTPSTIDGLHLDVEAHATVAQKMHETILELSGVLTQ